MDVNELAETASPMIESLGGVASPIITVAAILGGGFILFKLLKVLTQNDEKTVLRKKEHERNEQEYENDVEENTVKIEEFRKEAGEIMKEIDENNEEAKKTKRVVDNIVNDTVSNIEKNDNNTIEESKRRIQDIINRMKK